MEISLKKQQVTHFRRLCSILTKYPGAGDTSTCGTGKTVVAMAVAKELGLKMAVVVVNSSVSPWEEELKKYGMEGRVINFEKLYCRSNKETLWVSRKKAVVNGKETYTIEASSYFLEYAKDGILLVFDEVHNVKNESAISSKASHALVRAISGTCSRTLFTSYTPFEDGIFANSIVKILGFVTRDKMYERNPSTHSYKIAGHGLSQLMAFCKRIDEKELNIIRQEFPLDSRNSKMMAYYLYTRILKKRVLSSMPPLKTKHKFDIYNGFFKMDPVDDETIENGYKLLKGFVRKNGTVGVSTIDAQKIVESGKLNKIVSLVEARLKQDPKAKIIIFVTFTSSMIKLEKKLSHHNPSIMNHKTKKNERNETIAMFQAPDTVCNIIITSPRIAGTSLNLGDIHGEFKRVVYIVPTYRYNMDCQAARRVMRLTTKSAAEVYIVYSKRFPKENVLLNQIRKSKIHKEVVYNSDDILEVENHIKLIENDDGSMQHPLI